MSGNGINVLLFAALVAVDVVVGGGLIGQLFGRNANFPRRSTFN